jgi:hypothetical protein
MARFYVVSRSALDAPEYADPARPPDQRTYDAVRLVRRATLTGEHYANFRAG